MCGHSWTTNVRVERDEVSSLLADATLVRALLGHVDELRAEVGRVVLTVELVLGRAVGCKVKVKVKVKVK
jgi:hypothetical protein